MDDDDEMTPDAFRAAIAQGVPATLVPGPRPVVVDVPDQATTLHVMTATVGVTVGSQLAGYGWHGPNPLPSIGHKWPATLPAGNLR